MRTAEKNTSVGKGDVINVFLNELDERTYYGHHGQEK